MDKLNTDALEAQLNEIACFASERWRAHQNGKHPLVPKTKPDGTSVTDLDVEVERRVIEVATQWVPGSQVIAEESFTPSGLARLDWDAPLWVVIDPIDGTSSLLKGAGEVSVLFAVLRRTKEAVVPEFSYIANLTQQTVFVANEGGKMRRRPFQGASEPLLPLPSVGPRRTQVAVSSGSRTRLSSVKKGSQPHPPAPLQLADGGVAG